MGKFNLIQAVTKIIYIISITLLVISCRKEPVRYYHILNGNDTTYIKGNVKNNMEEGEWSIASKKGKLLANGLYNNGLKEGRWQYNMQDSLIHINWKIYVNKEKQIRLNIPVNWIVIEHKDVLFQATFNTTSKNIKTKYLLIGTSKISDSISSLKSYFDLSQRVVNSRIKVIDRQSFLVYNGENQFYLSRYIYPRDGEELIVFNFIGLINNEIVDIAYSSLNEEQEYKKLLFFELLIGCYYSNNRVLNPLNTIYFEKIE